MSEVLRRGGEGRGEETHFHKEHGGKEPACNCSPAPIQQNCMLWIPWVFVLNNNDCCRVCARATKKMERARGKKNGRDKKNSREVTEPTSSVSTEFTGIPASKKAVTTALTGSLIALCRSDSRWKGRQKHTQKNDKRGKPKWRGKRTTERVLPSC